MQYLRCRYLREGWGFPVRHAIHRRPDSMRRAINFAPRAIGGSRMSERAEKRNLSISSIIMVCDSRDAWTRYTRIKGLPKPKQIPSIYSRWNYILLLVHGESISRQT